MEIMNHALGTKKYVIPCPNCGTYAEASKGFLGIFGKTRKINCGGCHQTFTINEAKLTTKVCTHCGNGVILDLSQGEDAVCPVCHKKINTRDSLSSLVDISCPTCSCRHTVDKNADTFTCPLCDTVIDVQLQRSKEAEKNKGAASLIKFEGSNDVFVWKHPIEDFNLGSQLIVHESQEAIFFKDGEALDLFGAGRYTLSTQNLPLLEDLYKLPFGDKTIFHSEIYFINMTTQMGIKWGTDSKVRLFDPGSGLYVEIGACGSFNLRVNDSRKLLLKVVGTENGLTQKEIFEDGDAYGTSGMLGKFRSLVMNKVKSNLARSIKEKNINILEVDEHIDVLSENLRPILNESLDEYGLVIPEFYITRIITPDDDPNFRRLKEQFAAKTLKVREEEIKKAEAEAARERKLVEAQTEAQLKMVGAQGEAEALKIKALAEAEAYKAQAFAEAEEMKAKGYTYQQETARQVGLEAMQNGITGNSSGGGAGGAIGDIASLGVTLGAMGGVIGLTKDALSPIMGSSASLGAGFGSVVSGNIPQNGTVPQANTWDCSCGMKGITSKCCPECGSKRPEPVKPDTWDCECGEKGITSKCCPECGKKRPEPVKPDTWDCECGEKGITSKCCPECGKKRPELVKNDTWDCPKCGEKGITRKFCPECGEPRPEAVREDNDNG